MYIIVVLLEDIATIAVSVTRIRRYLEWLLGSPRLIWPPEGV